MAYSMGQRFSGPPRYFVFYDPGAYQYEKPKTEPNKVAFLSKTPRKSSPAGISWTQAIYDRSQPHRIHNISSLKFKQKRFPYEAFSVEDLKEILCKCGIENPCECPISEEEVIEKEVCQAKVRRRIFKGICPKPVLFDDDFALLNEPRRRIEDDSPPFYDARVNEATAFYQGWKWSRRTSKRTQSTLEQRPGPADYNLEREPTQDEICAEQVRAYKRKTARQLRFLEIIQQQNILEGRPGPATYNPTLPKGTDLQYIGSKSERFPIPKHEVFPGPADHFIRRDFDPLEPPDKPCHATFPEPPFFGVKAKRFRSQQEEGASPASYNLNDKFCNFVHCSTTPFNSSTLRFKPDIFEESDDEDIQTDVPATSVCPTPTWTFKSKTIRMKPLVKKFNEPSPADFSQPKCAIGRSPKAQYIAPFHSSVGRFEEWYNDMPIHGKTNRLEPIFCDLEKAKCLPAVNHGPLCRAPRFPKKKAISPAPNTYTLPDKMKSILKTYNLRLSNNVENQHKFIWKKPIEPKSLSYAQREAILLQKSIALLEPDEDLGKIGRRKSKVKMKKQVATDKVDDADKDKEETEDKKENIAKPKMLRSFLYAYQMPIYF